MSAHKFQDRDVRSSPTLMAHAVRYAREYHGDFEFLQAAAAAANATGVLPVGVARGVLNCMRTDPRWADVLPEPLGSDPEDWKNPFSTVMNTVVPDMFKEKSKPKLTLVPPRRYIRVNVRLKFTYFWNSSYVPDAKNVFHIVSMETKSHLEDSKIQIYLAPICRSTYANTAFIKVGNSPPSRYDLCGSCNVQLKKGERHYQKALELKAQ